MAKPDEAISKIRAERGLAVRVAEACGIDPAAVRQWRQVPASRVQTVAPLLGMSLDQVRPDIFPSSKKA